MTTYFPAKKNTAFIAYIGLPSVASPNTFQSNPTIAPGDFKVSIDGGTLTNLTNLPAVTPSSSKLVQISLTAAEMNGDNIMVVASDAAGSEWKDALLPIQTCAVTIDDINTTLATIAGYIDTEVAAIKAKTDNLPSDPASVGDIPSAADNAAALMTSVVEGSVTVKHSLQLSNAAAAGKTDGMDGDTAYVRDIGDTKNRITALLDGVGNRSGVTILVDD